MEVSATAPECIDIPPPDKCAIEISTLDVAGNKQAGDAVCSEGTIDNAETVRAGMLQKGASFNGVIDELRVSNYAKREFEIAASSRTASRYTQVLSREVDLRNELPVGSQVAREVRAYDMRGEIVTTWKRVRGQSASDEFLARYIDDTLGREGSHEYPDGEVTVNRYDHTGLQVGLTGYGTLIGSRMQGRQVYLESVTATMTGRIESQRFGNGMATSYFYDDGPTRNGGFGSDLVTGQLIQGPTSLLSQRTYIWDKVGNLESTQDPAQQYQATYTYDDLNRVKTASFIVVGQNSGFSYNYDSHGNLTLKEGATQDYGRSINPSGCGVGSTKLPHAIARRTMNQVVDTYCYDEAGRLVNSSDKANNNNRNLYYWARGKPGKLSERNGDHNFSYDGNGSRVAKSEMGKITIEPYSFTREVANGSEVMYSANGALLARRTGLQPTEVLWYHTDHLGGTNLMTDGVGGEVPSTRAFYRPFGEFLGAQPQTDKSGYRQFTSKELDASGLYDFGARAYDSTTGRFLQPDIISTGSSPQDQNRYTYVLNNPIVNVDPTGRTCQMANGLWQCTVRMDVPKGFRKDPTMNARLNEMEKRYNEAYTSAFNKLMNNPDREVSITIPNLPNFEVKVKAGAATKVMQKREIIVAPFRDYPQDDPKDLKTPAHTEDKNGGVDARTTIFTLGAVLPVTPDFGAEGGYNGMELAETLIVHEIIHDRAFEGRERTLHNDNSHAGYYDTAARRLLGMPILPGSEPVNSSPSPTRPNQRKDRAIPDYSRR